MQNMKKNKMGKNFNFGINTQCANSRCGGMPPVGMPIPTCPSGCTCAELVDPMIPDGERYCIPMGEAQYGRRK